MAMSILHELANLRNRLGDYSLGREVRKVCNRLS